MKIVIEIPDHVYEHAKNMSEDSNDEYEAMRAIAKGQEERLHGEWEKKPEISYDYFYCSECGYAYKHAFNFCPNCGASMISSNSEIEKLNSEKTCLNCGTSEQACELGNRARHGFCGNWTERG